MPFRIAASNCSSLQMPMPVSGSGVMFGATILPKGVSIGRPPANGWLLPGTVWQLAQSETIVRYRPRSICVNSWGSASPARQAALEKRRTAMARKSRYRLRIDKSPRALQIFGSDRGGSPIGKSSDCKGRVVAGVLRKCAGAEDEQVRHVPALEVAIDDTGGGIATHHGSAVEMRRLIGRDVVRPFAVLHVELVRAHGLDDFRELV